MPPRIATRWSSSSNSMTCIRIPFCAMESNKSVWSIWVNSSRQQTLLSRSQIHAYRAVTIWLVPTMTSLALLVPMVRISPRKISIRQPISRSCKDIRRLDVYEYSLILVSVGREILLLVLRLWSHVSTLQCVPPPVAVSMMSINRDQSHPLWNSSASPTVRRLLSP